MTYNGFVNVTQKGGKSKQPIKDISKYNYTLVETIEKNIYGADFQQVAIMDSELYSNDCGKISNCWSTSLFGLSQLK